MTSSVEASFLVNFAVDAALIGVVARANGCFCMRRVALGALIGALYALAVSQISARLAHPAVQLALAAPVALIVSGDPDPRRWGAVAFQLLCGALLLGGAGMLLPESLRAAVPLALAAGLVAFNLLLSLRRKRLNGWEVTVFLSVQGRTAGFRALIDTGNRLREPVSGLPVLIAESALLKNLLVSDTGAPPCRFIAYGALGGGGTVRCFHPDAVLIRRGDRLVRAPEVWVAVYPGRMPGPTRALAPPSFAIVHGNA